MEGSYNTSSDKASYITSFNDSEPDDYYYLPESDFPYHTDDPYYWPESDFPYHTDDPYYWPESDFPYHTDDPYYWPESDFPYHTDDPYYWPESDFPYHTDDPYYWPESDFPYHPDDPYYWPETDFPYEPDRYLSEAVLEASWIVISISIPLILVAIRALYSLVRDNHVVPVYVINLLISDLIQMCCFVMLLAAPQHLILTSTRLYYAGLMASVGSLVCVAMERYLLIAWPVWYRLRRNVKVSLVVCFMVWVIPSVYFILFFCTIDSVIQDILLSSYVLLPFPLLIFFLAGSLKALSSSISVAPEEKRLIVGTLVLVLLNYALFLPSIILLLYMTVMKCSNAPFILLQFSPFIDLVLYVFMMKGAVDKLLAYLCRCRMTTEQEQGQIPTVDSITPQMAAPYVEKPGNIQVSVRKQAQGPVKWWQEKTGTDD
ncbi:proto-oncogene Mas-like [Myripristis murdjan]|uniref:proto-oncogene Mas-like n=1 Tax=Myripristis murdjan TaxID=586833 RepID=UPI001175FE0A|nr:proto-oncogene Mas-like [Myripristis murdjan]